MNINPANVTKALQEVPPAGMPTSEVLVKVMIEKVTPEDM